MLLLILACARDGAESATDAPDLTATLGPDEVRAGTVLDAAALFGGVAAEGRLGDVKIYNDRARFVIQQPGASNYYHEYGGALIDADTVRPAGEPGRDLVDELAVMVGLGRVVNAERVIVLDDGRDGVARVRVEGPTAPLQLVTGALETPTLVPDIDLWVTTDYELRPGEWTLRVTTTVENRDEEAALQIGEVGIVAAELGETWRPGLGRNAADADATDWIAFVGKHNEGAVALVGEDDPLEQGTIGSILGALAPTIVGFGPTEVIPTGGTATWVHRVGAAPDPATLSAEQRARRGAGGQRLGGTVSSGGRPVAGARVTVLDAAGAPETLAFTGADGAWTALVGGGAVSVVASGRGDGIQVDLPAGHGNVSPYEPDPAATLATLADGAAGPAFAEGYGLGTPQSPWSELELVTPANVELSVADGGPAVARFYFAEGDPVVADDRLVPGRPDGCVAVAFVRDGRMDVALEPGAYTLVVNRGVREEVAVVPLDVTAGERVPVEVSLPAAYTLDGVVVGDPHSHAAPSGDGGITMEDRLVVTAANGVDLHFGTDHDHIAAYQPLVAPLGLDARLRSVQAVEVSPVLRGHFNAWPAPASDAPNHGAPLWWFGYSDTTEIFGWMRALVGEDGIIQANHPVGDSGLFSFAGYEPGEGTVDDPAKWNADFDAMEVINSGDWEPYLPYYLDLARRGHPVVPVSVSDSHGHTSGRVGLAVTFFHTGTDLAGATDDVLRATMGRGETVASLGPFIDARMGGDWAPGTLVRPGTLDVVVRAPSWIPVESLTLWRDGVVVQTLTCTGAAPTPCEAQVELDGTADASWVLTASSTTPLGLVQPGTVPFAVAAAIRMDGDGDGTWTPPLPAGW